jgi:hypothetical protein
MLVLLVTTLCHFHLRSLQGCCVLTLEEKYKDLGGLRRHNLYTFTIFHEHLHVVSKVIRRNEQVAIMMP